MIMLESVLHVSMNSTAKQFRVAYSCHLHTQAHILTYSTAHINLLVNLTKEFFSISMIFHFTMEQTSELLLFFFIYFFNSQNFCT